MANEHARKRTAARRENPAHHLAHTSPPKKAHDPEYEDLIEPLWWNPPERVTLMDKARLVWVALRNYRKGTRMKTKSSWKTSAGGAAGAIGAAGVLLVQGAAWLRGEGIDIEQVTIAVTALATSIGLLFARDNNVSSEDAGAK